MLRGLRRNLCPKLLIGTALFASAIGFAKGGSEASGGGPGLPHNEKSVRPVVLPKLRNGKTFLPFGINPNDERKRLSALDITFRDDQSIVDQVIGHSTYSGNQMSRMSVFPYKPIFWKDPAQSDAGVRRACESLRVGTASPHCWALMNKIAQVRLNIPQFADFITAGLAKLTWKLGTPERIHDEGGVWQANKKDLFQLARRDGKTVTVAAQALSGGTDELAPMTYADFAAIVIHEAIYVMISEENDNSEAVRASVAGLFRFQCPAVGQIQRLAFKRNLSWTCYAGSLYPGGGGPSYTSIQDSWAWLQSAIKGKAKMSMWWNGPERAPLALNPRGDYRGVAKDLIRFALLQTRSLELLNGKASDSIRPGDFDLIDRSWSQDEAWMPIGDDTYEFLVAFNAATHNILGFGSFPNSLPRITAKGDEISTFYLDALTPESFLFNPYRYQ